MKRCSGILLIFGLLLLPRHASAILVDALDPARQWRVAEIEFFGNEIFAADELAAAIVTKARPWYRFWQERPKFDPITFTTDLERLRRFYEAAGYYDAVVTYDLIADDEPGLVRARIALQEGRPIRIAAIDVAVTAPPGQKPPLPDSLPVKRGEIFGESEYQQAEQTLRNSFLEAGYAYTKTERRAEVNLDEGSARIHYSIEPGPLAEFGRTEVKGAESVDPQLIYRELAYQAGEPYALSKLIETRDRLLALDLFSAARVGPQPIAGVSPVVPMQVEVSEKSHREIKLALGYSTEDQFRSQLEWRHLNWLGGGRRLSVLAKYSSINIAGAVSFIQPHFLTPRTRAIVDFRHDQEDEQTYLRNVTRAVPRLDHRFTAALTGFVGYRFEYNKLNDVAAATTQALGDVRRDGFVSGLTAGLVWNTSDDPFSPKKGEVISLNFDQAGAIWGGDYRFYKMTAEAKKYLEVGWQTVLAGRLRLGLGHPIGRDKNFPLFERFFAGGEKSVRGYGRRRLGPLTASDDPLGGLSLLEGSVELRRPIWKELSGAVFIDFGQVSKDSFDLPLRNLRFSSGFGVSYTTPVGPLRLDVGFPFKAPPGDRPWQIHFSIGAYF